MVKRYGVRMRKHGGDHSPYMATEVEMLDGEYVKYADYAKLQSRVEQQMLIINTDEGVSEVYRKNQELQAALTETLKKEQEQALEILALKAKLAFHNSLLDPSIKGEK